MHHWLACMVYSVVSHCVQDHVVLAKEAPLSSLFACPVFELGACAHARCLSLCACAVLCVMTEQHTGTVRVRDGFAWLCLLCLPAGSCLLLSCVSQETGKGPRIQRDSQRYACLLSFEFWLRLCSGHAWGVSSLNSPWVSAVEVTLKY